MKKLFLLLALVLIVFLASCGTEGNNDTPSVEKGVDEDVSAAEDESKDNEEADIERKEKERADNETSEKEDAHLALMQENMGMYVDIDLDKESKIFTMTPVNEELIAEIEMLEYGVGFNEWRDMVDGIVSMSNANAESLGEGYTITLINPLNPDNVILWIVDGTVIYDVVDEL